MLENADLKLHFVNVNHGDATIIEFPDYLPENTAHFAVVDFGAKKAVDRGLTRDYLQALIDLRRGDDGDPFDYRIEFACVTHPHNDHYGGLKRFMEHFGTAGQDKVEAFWDCGFRTNSIDYNDVLDEVIRNDKITFVRLGSGSEFEFGETRITVLAPSVDLRNRFDTFGIGKNDASIVLRVKFRDSYAILAADAEYASWGKITEEFPRTQTIDFFEDALGLSEREDTADQLKCSLLKMAHHGSKHGTSLEYLERLKPRHVVIPAGSQDWYDANVESWVGKFPHDLVTRTIEVLDSSLVPLVTGNEGNLIFKFGGGFSPRPVARIPERPGTPGFKAALEARWA